MIFTVRAWKVFAVCCAAIAGFFLAFSPDVFAGYHANTTITLNRNLEGSGSGEVGHWTFNGKDSVNYFADVSGNGNNATSTGFSSTTTVPGAIGQALDFKSATAVSSALKTSPASSLNITGDFTFAAWDKMKNPANGGLVFSKTNGSTWDYEWGYSTTAGHVGNIWLWWTGITPVYNSIGTTTDTKWHHIAITRKGAAITFYIDGAATGTASDATAFQNHSYGLWFGNDNTNALSSTQNDAYNDVRLYNRALSQAEISRLYALGANQAVNRTITTNSKLSGLNSGEVGHWTFNGKDSVNYFADVSGNGNNATSTGFSSTTTVPGAIGQALDFKSATAVSSALKTSPASSLNITGDFTFAAWDKMKNPANGGLVFSKTNGSTWDYEWGYSTTAGHVGNIWLWWTGITPVYYSIGTTTDTKWHHIAITRKGAAITFYIDGAATGTASDATAFQNHSYGLWFGNDNTNALSSTQNDAYNDVRLYNRALSQAEISRLYALGANQAVNRSIRTNPKLGGTSGLVLHWTFDGKDMTSNVADASGNGNTGILTSFTSTTSVPGKIGQALSFNGMNNSLSTSTNTAIPSINTVSFWMKAATSTASSTIMAINSAADVKVLANAVTARGWTSPTIYVDGVSGATTVNDLKWHHVVITSSTSITPSTIAIGTVNNQNYGGYLDDFRLYNRALSQAEISRLYNLGN